MPSARGVRAGRAYVEVSLLDRLDVGFRRAEAKAQRFAANMRAMSQKLFAAGGALTAGLTAATLPFVAFDDQMREVAAVTSSTEEEFARLTEQAKELGRTTSFTATAVGQLQAEYGRAGFSPDEIINATEATLHLARATKTELPEAAGIAAAALRQFGLDASESGRVTDRLAYAANNSFNTLGSLGEALKYAGPVAADLGMSLEDTLAILMQLGNIGIQGTGAGTAVKRLSVLAAGEAEKLEAIFGRSFRTASGDALPLVDVLEQINDATKNLGSADRTAKLNQAFGLLGITGASAIGKAAGSVKDFRQALDEADGAAQQTSEMMDAGLGGSVRRLWSAVEGIALSIGGALDKGLRKWIDGLSGVAGAITELIDSNPQLVQGVAAVAAGLLAAGTAALGMSLAGSVVAGSLRFLRGSMIATKAVVAALTAAFAIGPIGLIGGALLTGLFAATGGLSSLSQAFRGVSSVATESIGAIVARISAGDLVGAWNIALAAMKAAWSEVVLAFTPQWTGFTTAISDTWKATVSLFSDLWSGFGDLFAPVVDYAKSVWKSFVGEVSENTGAQDVELSWTSVTHGLSEMFIRLEGTALSIWESIKKAALDAGDALYSRWKSVVAGVSKFLVSIPGVAKLLGSDADELRKEIDAQLKIDLDNRAKQSEERAEQTADRKAEIARETTQTVETLDEDRQRKESTQQQAVDDAVAAAQAKRDEARKALDAAINAEPAEETEAAAKQTDATTQQWDATAKLKNELQQLVELKQTSASAAVAGGGFGIADLAKLTGIDAGKIKALQGGRDTAFTLAERSSSSSGTFNAQVASQTSYAPQTQMERVENQLSQVNATLNQIEANTDLEAV